MGSEQGKENRSRVENEMKKYLNNSQKEITKDFTKEKETKRKKQYKNIRQMENSRYPQ